MATTGSDRAEAAFWASFIRNRNVDAASSDDGAVAVAGGYADYVAGTYHQIALAIGSTRPLRDEDLDALEAFYRRRGAPVRAELRDDVLARDRELFDARAYAVDDLTLAWYETDAVPAAAPPIAARLERNRATWVTVVTRAFAEGGIPDEMSRRSADLCAAAASALFVVEVDGALAGAGAVAVAGDAALLYCGAVAPAFRRRGAHRALLHARAAFGLSRGASRTIVKVPVGSDSESSVRAAGFRRTLSLRRVHAA
jgi:ribosomal protein S18 acetylase RimI-like enzyme